MQLSHPAVGHGVVESKVESGSVFKHPIKRSRTTFTYLAVATMGTQRDKDAYRHAVDTVHQHVRSDDNSPVAYNAFDRHLQLWVAACLYHGVQDCLHVFGTTLDGPGWDSLYQQSASLGTTLQVPPQRWPADRARFEEYWDEQLPSMIIDAAVRDYFNALLDLKMFPRPIQMIGARLHRFVTAGFLPQHLRDQMGMPWTPAHQQRWDTVMHQLGRIHRTLPPTLRRFPFNACLWDLRRRLATSRPLL